MSKEEEKIEELQTELDKVYEELYELKSKKQKDYLFDAHFELINDIQDGIIVKIKEYNKIENVDDEPTLEDFVDVLTNFKRYIQEYKKSYNLR